MWSFQIPRGMGLWNPMSRKKRETWGTLGREKPVRPKNALRPLRMWAG
jgi:hypothetical protein